MVQQRPLRIKLITTPDTELTGLTTQLRELGHEVTYVINDDGTDLFIGERCGRVTAAMVPYIDVMLKEVQKGKYGKRQSKKVARGKRV